MIEYVIGGLVAGWWYGSSGKPATKVVRHKLLGPKSGRTWSAEEIPDLGIMIVNGSGITKVVFKRTPEGLKAAKAAGNPQEVALIRSDFDASK